MSKDYRYVMSSLRFFAGQEESAKQCKVGISADIIYGLDTVLSVRAKVLPLRFAARQWNCE